jgi:DNA mismatch repair protein MutL
MNKIRILPEIVANKIAAGEVVERPASVVKELVENALDAQSSRIFIDIEKGGSALIRVGDNGTGMGGDDAVLALERFATSKLHSDADLFAIQTLGFRGEALPSMAAVSKMTLVSRHCSADSGVAVEIHGGKMVSVNETGAPKGTLVSVAQLFYNTPARRKFLKGVNTEMAHIADTVAGMALGWPQVHFKLTHNAKVVKQWPGTIDAAQRVADVMGQTAPSEMVRFDVAAGDLKLSGHLAPARMTRSTSRGIYLYVNGRRVRDRVVQHALLEGFSGRLIKGQFPLAVIFLQLPFDQVDVNVHPTKHEIRFADQRRVHDLLRDGVAQALEGSERRLWGATGTPPDPAPAAVAEAPLPYTIKARQRPGPAQPDGLFCYHGAPAPGKMDRPTPVRSAPGTGAIPAVAPSAAPDRPAAPDQQTLWAASHFADLTVIGQFHGTYILCQSEQALILIDQHAAHERIVYEQLNARAGRVASQRLLMPETVELGFAEAQVLEALIPELNTLGLEIEPFGGTTFAVKAVPTLLDDRDIASVVAALAERAVEMGLADGLAPVLDACRMVMACHNAVRAHKKLSPEQVRHMLVQLDQCRNPAHCPHGRPTWIQYTLKELERAFKRIAG